MKQVNRSDYPADRIQRLFSGIPFFNEVLRADEEQFNRLMELCELLEADPGDTVIRQGDSDSCLYFLLRGQLAVMAENGGSQSQPLNYISPGEVFGTLAMIRGTPRTATIRVDESAREAVLAKLDYVHFNDINDFSVLSMETKVGFYRMVVHNIRWTLEVNKMQDPSNPLVTALRKVPLYTGPKGGEEELKALHEQAHGLADLLCRWNEMPQTNSSVQVT